MLSTERKDAFCQLSQIVTIDHVCGYLISSYYSPSCETYWQQLSEWISAEELIRHNLAEEYLREVSGMAVFRLFQGSERRNT
jgi:hypothetical protein